jgi:hypothetical protein
MDWCLPLPREVSTALTRASCLVPRQPLAPVLGIVGIARRPPLCFIFFLAIYKL